MHVFVDKLARLFALVGGLTLSLLIILVCASVFGRSLSDVLHSDLLQMNIPGVANWLLGLGVGPVNGDFEIVEAGMAFAIFAFFPICQLRSAHASVDVFTQTLPASVNRFMRFIIDVVFAAVLILLAYYLLLGGLSKLRSGQTTLLLEFPVWWSYAASVIALGAAALVSIYVAVMRGVELKTGQSGLLADDGADH